MKYAIPLLPVSGRTGNFLLTISIFWISELFVTILGSAVKMYPSGEHISLIQYSSRKSLSNVALPSEFVVWTPEIYHVLSLYTVSAAYMIQSEPTANVMSFTAWSRQTCLVSYMVQQFCTLSNRLITPVCFWPCLLWSTWLQITFSVWS